MAPLTHDISGQVGINSATWTRDGHFLMTGGEDGFVRLWDVMAGDPLINSLESNSPICACDISQYYDMVIAGDEASTVKVWSLSGSQYIINDEDLVHINNSDRYMSDNLAGADLFQVIDDIQLSDLREGVLVNNVVRQDQQEIPHRIQNNNNNNISNNNQQPQQQHSATMEIPLIDLIPYNEPFFSSASEEYDSDDL
jgi:WD40 repeat protein